MPLEIGQRAPAFSGLTTQGKPIALGDFRGRYLVLYFYPKAFSPGCTRQALRFQGSYPELKALGAEVVGISTDDLETQCDFAGQHEVTFPLLGDKDRAISRAYDVVGRVLPLDRRVTYVIDPEGAIVARFEHAFQVSKHLDEVLAFLKEKQRS